MTTSDKINLSIAIITAIGLLFTIIGIFITAWQINRGIRQRSNTTVADAIQNVMKDPMLSYIFYQIEYSRFQYDPANFHGKEIEKQVDSLLSFFDRLAREHESGLLSLKDLGPISYKYLRVWEDTEINKYLRFLNDNWQKSCGYKYQTFSSFRKIGLKLSKKYKIKS